jgi:broad specificity phosphatase PhoE
LEGERDAPLHPSSQPGVELVQLARNADFLVATPLRRSRESARLLSPHAAPTIAEDAREAALPSALRSRLRLPPDLWAGVARVAWFCGWSPGVESLGDTRLRAARAAQTLQGMAAQGDVLVIGHGLMNALIAAQLRALGWKGPLFPSRPHWGFGTYSPAQQAVAGAVEPQRPPEA